MATHADHHRTIMDERDTDGDEPLFTEERQLNESGGSLSSTLPATWAKIHDLTDEDAVVIDVHPDRLEVHVSHE